MGRFVNSGNSAFQVALNSEIYVDKTGLLAYTNKVMDTTAKFICNSRPRRFGKSITADMLTAYYCKGCSSEEMFSFLEIGQAPGCTKYLNQYDVIHLDIQWCMEQAGGPDLIVSYILSTKLPVNTDISFVIWLAFVVVLVCAIDLLMARFITKPVSELNEAARNMAELNFSHPCHVKSHDEFGELAESLNTMAENLQQAFSSLEDANRKLEQDVEQKKRLLAERKELVANLSHEMKTPLGVIRAYAEGLQDETDEAKRQKYSEVIITETERMSRLITTLLDLSALENGATQLRPERFDFVDFLETVAGRLLIDTPDADFVLEYALPEHPVYVNTDKVRMEQVLNNLIVNAKRNNRPGGILRLSLLEKDGLLNFSIFNQGPPIPEESLSKIWSKFYRDKNSKYSGSGLGLAIVAQVLSMQHLHYGAENQPGGVAFYFSLPTVK